MGKSVATSTLQKTGASDVLGGVPEAAMFFGTTEKAIRRRVDRGLIPCRRWGTKLIFLRSELEGLIRSLPGVTLDEARANREARMMR